MTFRVKHYDPAGDVVSRLVVARSADEAVKVLNIPKSRLIESKESRISTILSTLTSKAPPLDIQARVLAVFSAQVASGSNQSLTFDNICSGYKIFKPLMKECTETAKISDKMSVLRFNSEIQLLAEVGEQSGMIGDVLAGAADDIIERQRILGEIKSKIVPSLAVGILGIIITMVLPIFIKGPLNMIKGTQGMKIEYNIMTTIMEWLGNNVPVIWPAIVAGVAAAIVFRGNYWPYIKKIPGLSVIEDFNQTANAYRFLSSFLPLLSRRVPLMQSVQTLERYATGSAKKAYATMVESLTSGKPFSQAFNDPYWHPLLRDCLANFDTISDKEKVALLIRVKPILINAINSIGRKLSTVFSYFGLFLSMFAVLMIIIGLQLPLMTMKTTTGVG